VPQGTNQEPARFAIITAQRSKITAKHEKNLSVARRCRIALWKQVQHARPHIVYGPVKHLVMQKPDPQRQKQGRELWVATRVKRKLLLDQGGSVLVAASKMHHVEQNGREL
jgi:hypothetical protein